MSKRILTNIFEKLQLSSTVQRNRYAIGSRSITSHSRKKTIYKESDKGEREKYLKEIENIEKSHRVYIAESGFNEYFFRTHARALHGKKVVDEISGRKFERINLVAAKRGREILAPLCYKEMTTGEFFENWIELTP